jgi:uncharacterized repeat protein (TIGR01451 family)
VQRNQKRIGVQTWKKKVRILISWLKSSRQKHKAKVQNSHSNFQPPQLLNSCHKLRSICRYGFIWLMTLLLVVVGYHPPAMTQPAPNSFPCDRSFYITQATAVTSPIQLNRIDTTTGNLTLSSIGGTTSGIRYNAIGFNVVDGYIYGIDPDPIGNPPNGQPEGRTVYRIDRNGVATSIGVPVGVAATGLIFAGDVDRNGNYYVLNRETNQILRLNVTGQAVATLVSSATLSTPPFPQTEIADIAFNPIDDQLYGFDSTSRQVVRINTTSGVVTFLPGAPPPNFLSGDDTVGAIFFDSFGNFYVYYSNSSPAGSPRSTGELAVARDLINANQGISFQFLGSPGPVLRFDGAACSYAPVVEKVVTPQTITAGGTVTYTYRIANSTLFPLPGLTFTDTMDNGRTFVAGSLSLTNIVGSTPNNYGGTSTLTIANITVPARTIATLSVQVKLPLNLTTTPVLNQATFQDIPPSLGGPILRSDYPPTGGFPDPTPLVVQPAPPTPRIGLAKRVASPPVNLGNGVFRVTYELVVRNYGNVDLNNVQVTEDLTTTFANATSFTVAPNSVSSPSGDLTPNPNYNGRADNPNLLAGTDNTLVVGASKTIQFIVDVTPGANLGPYNNQARVTGTGLGPNGTPIQADDFSQNGINPDPDADGIPSENEPTPVSFAENPVLGVAKAVVSIVDVGNGNFNVTYSIRAQNLGDVPLSNLQLTENLVNTFGTTPFTLPANAVTSPNGDLAPNPNYNGRSDTNLLAATNALNTLAVGQTKILQLVVTITPPNERRTFTNQVEGIATSPTGREVRDLSTAGISPDPNGDRNPIEQDTTPLPIGPNLRLVKRITNITRGGVPVSGVDFTSFTPDPGDDDDDVAGWSNLPGGVLSGVYRLNSDNPMQTGDEVEYTVYYLSDGTQSVTDAKVCDPIPEKTTFIPDSFQAGQGILLNQQAINTSLTNAPDTDQGTFFSRLTPVTSPCPNTNNSNGSILVNLGDLPTTSPNNVGFIRFRVKID